ncbi:MAG: hypothetical protein IPJ81_10620 [Chitinophagaceae bacterium]|nr:hypothetical protein [Chitinophagaceae bacterium]
MQKIYHKRIENFVAASTNDMFLGNGSYKTITNPKNDKDALIKGDIQVMDIDTRLSKGTSGALILLSKDIIIHGIKYRAVLYEGDNLINYVALYREIENNNFYFRYYPIDGVEDSMIQNLNYFNKNNYDLIKKFIKEKGKDIGSNFGVYTCAIANYLIFYTDKLGEEGMSINKMEDKYGYALGIKQDGKIEWNYLNIPLAWTKDSRERDLNEIFRTIVMKVNQSK